MMDWQPISTAPKDGTEILGWRYENGTLLVRWIAPVDFLTERELEENHLDSDEDSDWFFADFVRGGRLEGDECPTHWMPLPSPPTDKP
jgi:hypothetical protein